MRNHRAITIYVIIKITVVLLLVASDRLAADDYHTHTAYGVVRNIGDGSSWRVYDSNHHSEGLGNVTCRADGVLNIAFDPPGDITGAGDVHGDEHFARYDISTGVSGHKASIDVYMYHDTKRVSCRDKRVIGPKTNLWVDWEVVTH